MSKQHKSKIGGQALIEGVMMRGIDSVSMAVRTQSGEIVTDGWDIGSLAKPKWYRRIIILRGVINFVESMVLGYRCLMKSADMSGFVDFEEQEEPSPFEKKLEKLFGKHLVSIIMIIGTVLGVALALVLFMYVPSLIVSLINKIVGMPTILRTLIEGIIKISVFVSYLAIVSRLKDIKRVYQYHGAEHKVIACYEAGEEITPENAQKFTRFHPRCGTSFILIVLVVSILVFSVVSWNSVLLRTIIKIGLTPIVIGIAYEIIRLAGRYTNLCTKIISSPGLLLQRLTTNEPDKSQIEVAIAALTPVIPDDISQDNW